MELINKAYYITAKDGNETIVHKKIPEQDLDELRKFNEIILEFKYYQRKVKEIELNYLDYKSKYDFYKEKLAKKNIQKSKDFDLIFIDINRVFVNFITSIRTFVEHLEKKISRKYSKNSQEYLSYKKFVGNCYDKYFSYRFFYHLRNFSIHTDYPINSFFSDYEYDEDRNIKKFEFKVEFQKSHLLKDYDIKKKLNFDLCSYNEKFPVLPLVESILEPVSKFIPFIINLDHNYYLKAAEYIGDYILRFDPKNDISISQWILINEKTGKWNFYMLPLDLVNFIILKNPVQLD